MNPFQARAGELHKKLFHVIDRSAQKARPLTIAEYRVLNDVMDLLFDVRVDDPGAAARVLAAERGG